MRWLIALVLVGCGGARPATEPAAAPMAAPAPAAPSGVVVELEGGATMELPAHAAFHDEVDATQRGFVRARFWRLGDDAFVNLNEIVLAPEETCETRMAMDHESSLAARNDPALRQQTRIELVELRDVEGVPILHTEGTQLTTAGGWVHTIGAAVCKERTYVNVMLAVEGRELTDGDRAVVRAVLRSLKVRTIA